MNKFQRVVFTSIVIVCIAFVSYTIWDNYRIKVVKEDIIINNLPDELDGFQILQITDLHEKEFGKNQKRLLKKIHSLDYDVIVFTGDMLDNDESMNYQPFYSILEGINHHKPIIVVPGNADASSYQYSPNFDKSEFVAGIEERGATVLEPITTIDKEGQNIARVSFELGIIEDPANFGRTSGSAQADH